LIVAAGLVLLWLTVPLVFSPPISAVAATVTTHTGIAGLESVTGLVAALTATAWPGVTAAAWVVLLLAGVATLVTAHRWQRTGRRFDTGGRHAGTDPGTPLDAVDSWDELSRGDDPTR